MGHRVCQKKDSSRRAPKQMVEITIEVQRPESEDRYQQSIKGQRPHEFELEISDADSVIAKIAKSCQRVSDWSLTVLQLLQTSRTD